MADVLPLRLVLFGPMRLYKGDALVAGMTDQLFKALALLVLNGNCMNRDTLVERLWPERPVNVGRHHLRNLLTRLRMLTGVSVVRQGELVVLECEISCDIDEFIRHATRALADPGDAQRCADHGLRAQELWTGPPLEAWRYEPWAVQLRARAYGLQKGLWVALDRLAASQ